VKIDQEIPRIVSDFVKIKKRRVLILLFFLIV